MMLRVSGFVVKNDTNGWIIGKPRMSFSQALQKDVMTLTDPGHYTRLRHALVALLDRSLRESAAGSVTELLNEIKATERRIMERADELEERWKK